MTSDEIVPGMVIVMRKCHAYWVGEDGMAHVAQLVGSVCTLDKSRPYYPSEVISDLPNGPYTIYHNDLERRLAGVEIPRP